MNVNSIARKRLMSGPVRYWIDASLSWVYPDFCRVCSAEPASAKQGYVGEICRGADPEPQMATCSKCGAWIPGAVEAATHCANCRGRRLRFEFARSVTLAQGTPNFVIQRYKYNGELHFEPYLKELMSRWARERLAPNDWDAVLATPLHAKKRRIRGFNQSDILADAVAGSLGIPILNRVARRTRHTPTQTSLTRERRIENLNGAFEVHRPDRIPQGAALLIVDDVLTTGATMNALAGALLDAGAGRVAGVSLARGV